MEGTKRRVAALQKYLSALSGGKTKFIVEGGVEFFTRQDPFDYLVEHGAYTQDGRRIVSYPHPDKQVDAVSLALYQMIDEAIEAGKLELPDMTEHTDRADYISDNYTERN